MINPKYIIISVVFGFFLSFFVGLIAGVSFGIVLLRALLFAVVFGIVIYAALWIFQNFLSLGTDNSESSVESSNIPKTGTKIDISIGDESLPDDGSGPDFYVKDVSSSSSTEKVYKNEPVLSFSSEENAVEKQDIKSEPVNEFKPVTLGTPINSDGLDVSNENMDVLPDIGGFSVDAISANHGNVLENTDFALEGTSVEMNNTSTRQSSSGVMDTETIAKAIKTVLSKDS